MELQHRLYTVKKSGSANKCLAQFKSGKLRVLVATDLMARGIDIKSLPCVINYELPRSPKDYIHRMEEQVEPKHEDWPFVSNTRRRASL